MPFDNNGHLLDHDLEGIPKHKVESFLTQAMAQNIQIQKQLMEQNQALQKLLTDQHHNSNSNNNHSNNNPGARPTIIAPRKHSDSSTSSSHSMMAHNHNNHSGHGNHNNHSSSGSGEGFAPPPPPPPLPVDQFEGSRPFMDPYGRAKTVRIGKWRWPPRDNHDVFLINNSSSSNSHNNHSANHNSHNHSNHNNHNHHSKDPEEDDHHPHHHHQHPPQGNASSKQLTHHQSFPDQLVVGKLRISNEMRAKLENVTGGNKNGNGNGRKEGIRKIEDDRKNTLMEKLGGRALTIGQAETFSFVPPPPPPPVHDQIHHHRHHEVMHEIKEMASANKFEHVTNSSNQMSKQHQHQQQQQQQQQHEHHRQHQHQSQSHSQQQHQQHQQQQFQHHQIAQHHNQEMQMISASHSSNIRRDGGGGGGQMVVSHGPGSGNTSGLLHHDTTPTSNAMNTFCLSYGRVNWTLRLRKELLLPWENIEQDKKLLNLLYIQILNDMNSNTLRLTNGEKAKLRQLTSTTNSKLNIVQYTIKNTEFYFVVIFPVLVVGRNNPEFGGRYDGVSHVAVDLKSIKFIKKGEDGLICVESRSLTSVKIRDSKISESNVAIHEPYLSYLLNLTTFLNQSPVSPPQIVTELKTVPVEEMEEITEEERTMIKPNDDGKHSLLQFAMSYFRHMERYPNDNEWTWKSLVSNVKYGQGMIQESLLQLDEANNQLALECYEAVLCYMGDLQSDVSQVECVYTLLRNCHKSSKIIDELYCQLMKQTTNNNMSGLAGWRLFTIITAYFSCSELLKPYLFKYLEGTAYDKRRNYHGTALVSLQNLRKTFKYGGRRNVPSVEEITALTAGRNAKRQIFRLPGGNDRVVNVRAATIVEDVLNELCSTLNIRSAHERQEFSLYCIVEGDTFTMPLQLEEYILDVTTELTKNNQVFYLIFCRSVWFYELKLDNPLYVEVIFNQVAPDYLEGLLVVMQEERMSQAIVYDITRIAALLHRAADLTQPPTLKETKYLLPKPALAARDLKPNQWVQMVNSHWVDERIHDLLPHEAKCGVLEILQTWPLFGSSFFTLKRINEPQPTVDYILALNKSGVHFLDIVTHETMSTWTYNQVISTRKVKNEDGLLFLDLKVGNLMQQRILRLETEHAHEISRLIRQYIHIQRIESTGS